jgi:prepilin peptidase CpaA
LLLVAGFCGLAVVTGMSLSEFGWHVAAGALVLAVTFSFFACGWIGGGDAKLAAATALWFGFAHLLDYLVYASLFGGVLTLLLVQIRTWPLPAMLLNQGWAQRLHQKNGGIPYGIALAAAALVVYPQTAWMKVAGF